MTAKEKQTQEFVRRVIRDTFGQKVNEKTVKSVASQIVKQTTLEKPPVSRKRA
jgi:hypothetical protein